MKKRTKIVLWLLFFGCCCAFSYYFVSTRGLEDHTPPEITVAQPQLELSVYAEPEELLQGVTAWDDVDGDVTDLLVLESVSDIYDGNQAVATYAAFDQSNNVSKAQRTLIYTDYVSPVFSLTEPLIFRQGSNFNVFKPLQATDTLDGDLTQKIKGTVVSGESSVDQSGLYEVEFRVTNSLGDTVHLRLPVEVIATTMNCRLQLTQYLVYIKKSDTFQPMDYLEEGSRSVVGQIESDVDMRKSGVYSVTYHDENPELYRKTRLIVVVEE